MKANATKSGEWCGDGAYSDFWICAGLDVRPPRNRDAAIPGNSGTVMQEVRAVISEMDPWELKYKTRLRDYNNDPAVNFADLQRFFP